MIVFNQKGLSILEVVIATTISAASMWAFTAFYSSSMKNMKMMTNQSLNQRFESEVKTAVAPRVQAFLDKLAPVSLGVDQCNNTKPDTTDPLTNVSFEAAFTPAPVLDSGFQLVVLNRNNTDSFVNSLGTGQRRTVMESIQTNAPYWESFQRCTKGQSSSGVSLAPLYNMTGGFDTSANNPTFSLPTLPTSTVDATTFRNLSQFHFCLWLRPVDPAIAKAGIQAPLLFEGTYTVRNATTNEAVACRDLETGTVSEIQNTPLLFDTVASFLGCTRVGAAISCTHAACGAGLNATCLAAYTADATRRADLATRVKRSRLGSLNYELHWVVNSMSKDSFGKSAGSYVYSASN